MRKLVVAMALSLSSIGYGWDCDSDCGKSARFRYPCPTFGNPGRKCDGRDPATYTACETAKFASCQIWDGAVGAVSGKIKPMLQGTFNSGTWAHAENTGTTGDYMASCVAAGVSACAILGAELAGPWGPAIGGSIGTFVSFRVCEQSRSW
jgi:hypothetical protein